MKKLSFSTLMFLLLLAMLSSCVTRKKYQELETSRKNCDTENASLKQQLIDLTTRNNEMTAKIEMLEKQNSQLLRDTSSAGKSLRALQDQYNRLSNSYEEMNKMLNQSSQLSSAELQKLLGELQKAQEDLQKKEDLLKKNQKDIDAQKTDLDKLSLALAEKEKRLGELQSILDKKDSIVKALKNKVMDALTGFMGKGLSVEQKNGKVYVHMDEKLLFATGSFEVSPNGVEALRNLARVLETNPDINITVEGHTDNVAYKSGSGPINDNWDLSVMRATAVVKILLKNSSVDPKRIAAAGRSQFWPVDAANTTEARSKNRRTEIILTPKLDEIFKLLEGY